MSKINRAVEAIDEVREYLGWDEINVDLAAEIYAQVLWEKYGGFLQFVKILEIE